MDRNATHHKEDPAGESPRKGYKRQGQWNASTDEELVGLWNERGESEAFVELFNRQLAWLEPMLYGLLGGNRDLVVETRQDLVESLLKSIGSFRGEAKFSTFLYRMARNVAIDRLRREARKRKRFVDHPIASDGEAADSGDPEFETISKVERERLAAALGTVSEKDRVVLLMRFRDRLSYAEIGEIMGIGEGAARVRAFRARERLSSLLGGNGDE